LGNGPETYESYPPEAQSAHLKFIIMKLVSDTQAAITYLQGTNYRIRIVEYEGET